MKEMFTKENCAVKRDMVNSVYNTTRKIEDIISKSAEQDLLLAYARKKPASDIGFNSFENYNKKTNSTKADGEKINAVEHVLKQLGLKYKMQIGYNKEDAVVNGHMIRNCNVQSVNFLISKSKAKLDELVKAAESKDAVKIGKALGYGENSMHIDESSISFGEYMFRLIKDRDNGEKIPLELATISFIPPGANYKDPNVLKIARKNAEALRKVAPGFYNKLVSEFKDKIETAEIIFENDKEACVAFKTGGGMLVGYHFEKKGKNLKKKKAKSY